MASQSPARGDIWDLDLDPIRGHEQGGVRPCLVVSVDPLNQGPSGLAIVVPISSKDKRVRTQVPVVPPEGGLTQESFIKCEAVRSVSRDRFKRRRQPISPATMAEVEDRLRILLGL